METRGSTRWWIKTTIIVLAMFLFFVPAKKVYAEGRSGTCGDNLTWSLSDDETVLTISGSGRMTDYFYAPGNYGYYANRVVSPWSTEENVAGNSKITKVILPDGLISIGEYAFKDCSSLTSINIPHSVIDIGYGAFEGCSCLTGITIPNSVSIIRGHTFSFCTGLTDINIPYSVKSIGFDAFGNCSSLTSITIPNSVTRMEDWAFCNCSSLTSIKIPNSLTSIVDEAFYRCSSLTSITIPDSVTRIGYMSFEGCAITDVYYEGTKAQWEAIYFEHGNESLKNATIHYEVEPYKDLQWEVVDGKYYWYENNIRQGTESDSKCFSYDGTLRGREIYDPSSDGWYWLDVNADGAKAVGKEVFMPYIYQTQADWSEDEINANAAASGADADGNYEHAELADQVRRAIQNGTGKWVRYDNEGKMLKGWVTIEGDLAALYPDQIGNRYYYDRKTGLMAKGKTVIDGIEYYFDEITGALK